ncbi:hypothetical protein BASA60_010574 [Batrachochytrium salamandrivorans]|nr:hypothetical protein BASA60_010574 [Batrachochytrium salamandrivorans]
MLRRDWKQIVFLEMRKSEVKKQYNRALENWKKSTGSSDGQKKGKLKDAMEQRSYVEIQLHILEETLEQKRNKMTNIRAKWELRLAPALTEKSCRSSLTRLAKIMMTYLLPLMISRKAYKLDGVADREKDLEKQFELSQVHGKVADSPQ